MKVRQIRRSSLGTFGQSLRESTLIVCTRAILYLVVLPLTTFLITGCHTPAETAALTAGAIAGATVAGANSPAHEIEQVYYLGIFDPNEQVPTSIYRVRVHGQSSLLNATRFASGWVPAKFTDPLGSQMSLDANSSSSVNVAGAAASQDVALPKGRNLMVFGPEKVRLIPDDYRLTIVMSADPSQYFSAIDQMLGISAQAGNSSGGSASALQGSLLLAYQKLLVSQQQLQSVKIQP